MATPKAKPKPKPKPKPRTKRPAAAGPTDEERYKRHREAMAERSRERSIVGREIGPMPAVADPARRAAAAASFKVFCESYFPARFTKPFGTDHLEVIEVLETVIRFGGLFPLAMARGSGKTTLATTAILYAILNGLRRYVVFVASNSTVATKRLDELIRAELEGNPLLLADYPEVCFPIACLDSNSKRSRMQTHAGAFTRIVWGAGELRLPTVPGSPASGARIACAGLASGDIRGLLVRAPDGSLDRPDLVICDDPQTDQSARSPGQCDTREELITGAIVGMAGPGQRLAVVVPCTVIRPGDLSDRLLDRRRNPEWSGRKFRSVDRMPDRMDLWAEYGSILRDGLEQNPPDRTRAAAFYAANRAAMDAGAVLAWPDRQLDGEGAASAVQFAMDLYLLKPSVFAAEYQNDPLEQLHAGGAEAIDPAEVAGKGNGVARGTVPFECSRLVAFVDPKQEIIFWAVAGLDERFGLAVVDYGTFPRQHPGQFSGVDPGIPLSAVFRGAEYGLEARMFAGLTATAAEVLGRAYPRDGGGIEARVELLLVDAGWGSMSDTIHQWARASPFRDSIKASRGRYIGAAKAPMSQWKPGPGDRKGPGWMLKAGGSKYGREVLFDANLWKTFLAERARSPAGTPGALTVFGSRPADHKVFADHLGAEHPVRVSADGRTVDEWQLKPGRPDNDYLDCLVGCLVAGSVLGLRWDSGAAAGGEPSAPAPPKKKPLTYAEARGQRGQGAPAPAGGKAPPLRYADVRGGGKR